MRKRGICYRAENNVFVIPYIWKNVLHKANTWLSEIEIIQTSVTIISLKMRTTRGTSRSLRHASSLVRFKAFRLAMLPRGKRIYSTRGFRIPSTPIVGCTLPSHDSKILLRTFRSSRCQRLNHPINTRHGPRSFTLLTGDNIAPLRQTEIENNQRMI